MTLQIIDETQARAELKRAVERAGGQSAFAEKYGLNQCAVSQVLAGCRAPNAAICRALGIERITRYWRTDVSA